MHQLCLPCIQVHHDDTRAINWLAVNQYFKQYIPFDYIFSTFVTSLQRVWASAKANPLDRASPGGQVFLGNPDCFKLRVPLG
jgi:hypothetical protein